MLDAKRGRPSAAPKNPFEGLSETDARRKSLGLVADFVANWCERRPSTPVERARLRVEHVLTDDAVTRVNDYLRELRAFATAAGHPANVVQDPPEVRKARDVLDDPNYA